MENYSVNATLSASDNGFTSSMNSAASAVENLEAKTASGISSVTEFAGAFSLANKAITVAMNTINNSIGRAVDRVDTMNRFPKIMQSLGYTEAQANKVVQKLSSGIEGLPTTLDSIVASTQKLTLLTGNMDKAADASIALNDAFYASGSATEDASRGLIQYNQMLAKNKVDVMSWRTLQETMGVALNEIAASFGYVGETAQSDLYEALKSGEITFMDLNDRLIELDQEVGGFADRARSASEGIKTSFTNLGTAVVKGLANSINTADEALKENGLPGFNEQLKIAKNVVNETFSAIVSTIDTSVSLIAPGIKLITSNIDVLAPAMQTAAAGFVALKVYEQGAAWFNTLSTAIQKANADLALHATAAEKAATAKTALERATQAANVQATLENRAYKLSVDAAKAETAAVEASAAAKKIREQADRTAAKAAEEYAAAERIAAESTADKAATETAANAASKMKAKADRDATRAAIMAGEADRAEAKAIKIQESASRKTAAAKVAKSNAERADAVATTAESKAEEANSAAMEAGNVQITTKTLLLGVLSGKISLATAAQMAWNQALEANPIGAVVGSIAIMSGLVVGLEKAMDKLGVTSELAQNKTNRFSESMEELSTNLNDAKDSYQDSIAEMEGNATVIDSTVDKIESLSAIENKSAAEKAELSSAVSTLNSAMSDLNLMYDEENDKLSMSIPALKRKADAYKQTAKAQVYQERYIEILKEQQEVEDKLAEAQQLYQETQEKANKSHIAGKGGLTGYNATLVEQENIIAELTTKKEELQKAENALNDDIIANAQEQADVVSQAEQAKQQALADSIANHTVALEDLTEENQELVETMRKDYQDIADAATDMFDVIETKSDLSAQQMIDNMKKNQEAIAAWGDNMELLRNRFQILGLDTAVLEQLQSLGVDGAGYVAEFASATDTQLQDLADTFGNGGDLAWQKYMESLGVGADQIPESIQELATTTETSLRDSLSSADWSDIGSDVVSGLAEGMSDSSEAVAAITQTGTDVNEAGAESVGVHSPSVIFQEIGRYCVDGLALGLQDSGAATDAASQLGDNVVQAMTNSLANMQVSGNAFRSMAVQARLSMGSMTAAVQASMTKMVLATTAGMTMMNLSISLGMTGAKQAAVSGANGIVSPFNSLNGRMYQIGSWAVQGLANGINARRGAAIAAANSVANAVSQTMANALKVGSPSKVTTEIGEWTTIGAANGLENMIPKVKAASAMVANAMIPVTSPDWSSVSQRYSYAGDMTMHVSGGNAGSDMLSMLGEIKDAIQNQIIDVGVTSVMDGREVGYGSAQYVRERNNETDKLRNYLRGIR